jgi:hypothetical protein
MKRLSTILAAALMLGTAVPAFPQSGLREVPLGFCALTNMVGPAPLSVCNSGAGVPPGTTYAVICAYVQGINYRDDGGLPTSALGTGGQGIVPISSSVPTCIPYNGNFNALLFIQQNGGAILGVTFYK